MNRILLALCLALAVPFAPVGCQSAGSGQVVAAQTLLSVGQAAKTAVALSAQLYGDGTITAAQARKVGDFYDKTFQPAYRIAAAAVQGDMKQFAPADVLALLGQLTSLVQSLNTKPQ